MAISIDPQQAQILSEILESALHQLRIESARTDTHDFREALHQREKVVESLLAQLSNR